MSRHTLSVLVSNHSGVLARVAGLISRRGFNIESLAVGTTEHPDVSRMTIVMDLSLIHILLGTRCAHQRSRDIVVLQHPGDGQLGHRDAEFIGDRTQPLNALDRLLVCLLYTSRCV